MRDALQEFARELREDDDARRVVGFAAAGPPNVVPNTASREDAEPRTGAT
jgi:hypothetical protein